jgi:hypothetical protein
MKACELAAFIGSIPYQISTATSGVASFSRNGRFCAMEIGVASPLIVTHNPNNEKSG